MKNFFVCFVLFGISVHLSQLKDQKAKAPKCKNPLGLLGDTRLQGCKQLICVRIKNRATWKEQGHNVQAEKCLDLLDDHSKNTKKMFKNMKASMVLMKTSMDAMKVILENILKNTGTINSSEPTTTSTTTSTEIGGTINSSEPTTTSTTTSTHTTTPTSSSTSTSSTTTTSRKTSTSPTTTTSSTTSTSPTTTASTITSTSTTKSTTISTSTATTTTNTTTATTSTSTTSTEIGDSKTTTTDTTTSTTPTTLTPSPQCWEDADCQENAGCFADEVNIEPNSGDFITLCHCFLGFVLDTSAADFPKTGTCIDLRTAPCDDTSQDNCYDDSFALICPYCKAFLHHHDLEVSLGKYVSGEGTKDKGDPMIFEGGSAENCGGVQRTTEAYWYCWYDMSKEIVSLDHVYTEWIEDPLCHYTAKIYTPLACWLLPPI